MCRSFTRPAGTWIINPAWETFAAGNPAAATSARNLRNEDRSDSDRSAPSSSSVTSSIEGSLPGCTSPDERSAEGSGSNQRYFMPTPAVEGPAVEGPAVEGPAVEGPAAEGPIVEGPAAGGPGMDRPRNLNCE